MLNHEKKLTLPTQTQGAHKTKQAALTVAAVNGA